MFMTDLAFVKRSGVTNDFFRRYNENLRGTTKAMTSLL